MTPIITTLSIMAFNDTQHIGLICDTQHKQTTFSINDNQNKNTLFECHHAVCHYAECRGAVCHTSCVTERGSEVQTLSLKDINNTSSDQFH